MTPREAIAIIRKEYLCVDRDCDIERSCGKCDLNMPSKEPILEAYKMAMDALQEQADGDLISRKALREKLLEMGCLDDIPCRGVEIIDRMPSVAVKRGVSR